MKKVLSIAVVMLMCLGTMAQDVTVSSAVGQNIGTFINNEFVGSGVYVFNAKFNGVTGNIRAQWPQVGTFQANGFGGLSMDNGIILTTGNVSVAAGPNNSTSKSQAVNSPYQDPEIVSRGYNLNGSGYGSGSACATIDFDFVCLSNGVSFTYCFGSEEYNEYVFSDFNDVFMFLLTGPDPATGEVVTRNIAMIPGSVDSLHPDGVAVAINSVNSGTAGTYGSYPCTNCYNQYSGYYNNNDTLNDSYSYFYTDTNHGIQYDGYTTKLMAAGDILPCTQYHMHITVCNVYDNNFDSGVFLEGHSLTSPEVQIGLNRPTTDTVHRSTPLTVPISMQATQFDQATVKVRFGGEAISGIDYFFLAADGTVINNAENITVTNAPTYFTIQPLASANLSTPKTLDLYFASSLCDSFPNLLIYDTMHFILAEDVASPTPQPGDDSTGISTVVTDNSSLDVYPNPATSLITLTADVPMHYVTIFDIDGREVYAAAATGTETLSIDVSRLPKGVYTIQVNTASGIRSNRIVIK